MYPWLRRAVVPQTSGAWTECKWVNPAAATAPVAEIDLNSGVRALKMSRKTILSSDG